MTDKRTETESQSETDRLSSGPDGFVIIHRPLDKTVTPYGIGPFPPMEGLAEKVIAAKACDCECMALYVAFPKGLKMMLVADVGIPEELADMLREVIALTNNEPEGLVH